MKGILLRITIISHEIRNIDIVKTVKHMHISVPVRDKLAILSLQIDIMVLLIRYIP